jgi:hypothetical protein
MQTEVPSWLAHERIPWAVAALLGMLAGLAAKQAVTISEGNVPRPMQIVADVLILGVVFLIVMYVHAAMPSVPLEGIALLSASLAMWGPRGISRLVAAIRRKVGKATGLDLSDKEYATVDVISRPTVSDLPASYYVPQDEDQAAKLSAIAKIRDISPVSKTLPVDILQQLSTIDAIDDPANTVGRDTAGEATKSEGEDNG